MRWLSMSNLWERKNRHFGFQFRKIEETILNAHEIAVASNDFIQYEINQRINFEMNYRWFSSEIRSL